MIVCSVVFETHTHVCMSKRLEAFSSKYSLSLDTQDEDGCTMFPSVNIQIEGKCLTESSFLPPEHVCLKRGSHMEVLSSAVSVSVSIIPAEQLACGDTFLWKQKHTFLMFILACFRN